MVTYEVKYSKQAKKDAPKLKSAKLDLNAKKLIEIISNNPDQMPPPFEELKGNYKGIFSRRINGKHRLCYRVEESEKLILVVSMWSHYETLH